MWRLCRPCEGVGERGWHHRRTTNLLAIIGGLLIFLGIIGLIGTLVGGAASFVGGLVLIGLGILVTSKSAEDNPV
jgi:hypothetical protein